MLDSRDRSGVDVRHRFHSCTSLSSCLSRYGKPRGTVLYSGPQSTAAILTPCGRFVWERGIRCGGEPSHQGRRRSPDTSSCFPRNSYFGFAATSCVCRNLVVSWRGMIVAWDVHVARLVSRLPATRYACGKPRPGAGRARSNGRGETSHRTADGRGALSGARAGHSSAQRARCSSE